TDKMSELIWNNNYSALINDIANSRTPEEREQKISEHQAELDNYKASGINVANDIQYLRDNQGMETVSLFNKVASLISSYSYGGVEAQSILSPSNTAFDNVEYAADGTVTETNPDGVSSDEAIQQSEDRIKVLNGIWQEFSDFFSNPIVENLPLILGGTVVSTGLELQNSANPFGLSKGAGKAGDANDTQDTKSGNDPLKFKFGYFQSDGAPVFYATKDVVVQGSSNAEDRNTTPNNDIINNGQAKVENLTFINLGDGVYVADKNGISTDVSLKQAVKLGIAQGILPNPATMESDYRFIEGGFSIPLLKFAGIAGGFMMDKMGNVYAMVDASVGYGLGLPIPVAGSVGQGYFGNADKSDKGKYREALEGYSVGTTTGAGIQGNASVGTSGVISGEVSVTPGIGKTVGGRYAWYLFNIYD
ncbi:MAG: hypothetical protein ABFD91_17825, partial [Anaerohalosphaeraceae bacterium]